MRTARLRVLIVAGLVAATMALGSSAAWASCHRFTLEVSDDRVFEGDTVTAVVARIGDSAESSVVVSTAPGSASTADYRGVEERVSFAPGEREKSVDIEIVDDTEREATETFTVRVGAPEGCAGGPAFQLPPSVTITIIANDQTPQPPAPAPAPPPAPAPEPQPSPTAAAPTEPEESPDPEPEESPEPEPEPEPTEPEEPEPDPEDDSEQLAAEDQDPPSVPGWVFLALGAAVLATAWFVYSQLGREHPPPRP